MRDRENTRQSLEAQYTTVQRQISDQAGRDYDAEIILRNLKDFQRVFDALASHEQVEVLRCMVRDIIVHPDKLLLNIFELATLTHGSQESIAWLPGQDSNLRPAG